jgi:hypothetical protein
MNHRPHPGIALAVAAALVGTAAPMSPLSSPAAADEPLVEHCYTVALTDEEVEAGAVSEIDCYEAPADEPPLAMRSTILFAIVYDTDQLGSRLYVTSPSGVTTCTGGTTVFGTGNPWDNRISSTELWACGSAKHYASVNFNGTPNQLVAGAGYTPMTGTMNNATSSIEYSP